MAFCIKCVCTDVTFKQEKIYFVRGLKIQGGETRAHITRQQLLEQQRLPADDFGSFAQAHHQRLVAQRRVEHNQSCVFSKLAKIELPVSSA